MAVHTPIPKAEVRDVLLRLGVEGAEAATLEGVPEGSIHTTYRVRAAGRVYYLRRWEGAAGADVAYELALLRHLTSRLGGLGPRLPVPVAPGGRDPLLELAGGPAALFEAVPGAVRAPAELGGPALEALGSTLGRLHRAAADFPRRRPNPYGPATLEGWLTELERDPGSPEVAAALPRVRRGLEAGVRALARVPVLVCHGDPFPDNLHWEGAALCGVLDWEMACDAPVAWDLAVLLLVFAWGQRGPDLSRGVAILRGYAEAIGGLGPLPAPDVLTGAARLVAARYCMSRIRDFERSALPGERLRRKDWRVFDRRLQELEGPGAEALASLVARPDTR